MNNAARPYVVPPGITVGRVRDLYDGLVAVCDYGLDDGAFHSTLHYILAARRAGASDRTKLNVA